MSLYTPLLGRILISVIFIMSGLGKIGGWDQNIGIMASKGMPAVSLFLAGAIILEVFGGLSVILGYKARQGAIALIVFTVPASLIFHDFWVFEGVEQQTQMIMFMKNMAIIGGLLLITSFGSGSLSLDNRKKESQ